jgi:hypothetical protein
MMRLFSLRIEVAAERKVVTTGGTSCALAAWALDSLLHREYLRAVCGVRNCWGWVVLQMIVSPAERDDRAASPGSRTRGEDHVGTRSGS